MISDNLKINFEEFEDRTAGDIEIQKEILHKLKTDLKDIETNFIKEYKAGNINEVKDLAHRLKSTFGLFGIETLANYMKELEKDDTRYKSLSIEKINSLFNSAEKHIALIEKYLQDKQ